MLPTTRSRSRRATVLLAVMISLVQVTLLPSGASADDSSTLTVVGTSDVFDSNLVQAVLKPGFEAAYPQYTLNYVSKGTGAAITYAEAGTASALLVHAASLENQFVAAGYSNESYGRAIFWGDYVLLGPNADPVGVTATDAHDIVGAFEKVAAAGDLGNANFVSRGGTPGTTVQEHAIWALTTGVTLCDVSDANGGGKSPSTTTGACPTSITYPAWYHATGLTQGPNIVNADACSYTGGNCYVLTDRGTFNYLDSTHAVSNLKIITRDNDPAAVGGGSLLVNSFHAYAIRPGKFDPTTAAGINLPAATAFLNWVTSVAGQSAVGAYLAAGGDPPFIPDAAPRLTSSAVPSVISGGRHLKITGTLSNVVPGTPALNGVKVSLIRTTGTGPSATNTVVASGITDGAGKYAIDYVPNASRKYSLSVPGITKIENASLSPVFGDQLAPTSKSLGTVGVRGVPYRVHVAKKHNGFVTLKGRLAPTVLGKDAHLSLFAVHSKNLKKRGLHYIAQRHVKAGSTHFTVTFKLKSAHWTYRLRYVNKGDIVSGYSAQRKVRVR